MNNFIQITKKEFEEFLENNYWWKPYPKKLYGYNLLGEKENGYLKETEKETWEYCYFVPIIQDKIWLKVYSSVSRNTDISRGYGNDSVKIVPFSWEKLKPIMRKRPRIHRIKNWENNFKESINKIVEKLGNDLKCPDCKRNLKVKKNKIDKAVHFIGCKYPKCKFSCDIKITIAQDIT